MQDDLNNILKWFNDNDLKLNESKSNLVLFGSKQKLNSLSLTAQFQVFINNHLLKPINSVNFLGVTLDKHLSWDEHTVNICSKVSRILGQLSGIKFLLPSNVRKIIYQSLILPHFNYCSSVWSATTQKN